jgi:poly(3-hydroxybutyrate) depolymerase
MKFIRTPIASIGVTFALCLASCPTPAQQASSQQPVPQSADANRSVQPAARSWSNDPRVQSRSYVFTNTGETLPYAVFVSTRVSKNKPAPLIVALRGYGGNPGSFMWGPALNLAEEGGYIMVAPMGYTSGGNFGNPGGGGTPGNTVSKTSEYSEQDVMNVLAMVRKEFNIDDHRIYLMGVNGG